MHIDILVKRQKSPADSAYTQTFSYDGDGNLSVADFLRTTDVTWECSCLEKKCGACAMIINGKPTLACGVFLREAGAKGRISIAPLSKFPLVQDLQVDRSSMFDMLKHTRVWVEQKDSDTSNQDAPSLFKAGQCLLCGCCLEICPNFLADSPFGGAAFMANAYKAIAQSPAGQTRENLQKEYIDHFYKGCGQSLSCAGICPAGVPLDEIQARLNHRS
ncbi:MAG: 2Fe-2S iron-sulfur cluster-binding protein [Treponemataceae bacterium]|nr:2Fe-2S iron-sulfur cluster-binding protein [Treponemataceae bacterium]